MTEKNPTQTTSVQGLDRTIELAGRVCAARGLSVVGGKLVVERGERIVRITIEPTVPEGTVAGAPEDDPTVSLEECARVSRELSALLDEEDPIPGAYNLEVGSPGVERPLETLADFRRFAGRTAKVKLNTPVADGQRVLRGTIEAVSDGAVHMTVDAKPQQFPFEHVAWAHLVFVLPTAADRASKTGATAKGKPAKGKPAKAKLAKAAPAKAKPTRAKGLAAQSATSSKSKSPKPAAPGGERSIHSGGERS
jgi:ribosome maturation factor RimP